MLKILVTGSRVATLEMLELVDQIVLDAKADGCEIIVGDAEGVDARVIDQCDLLKVPITVYGAYSKMRRLSRTGFNYGLKGTYPDRDRYMAEKCDECIVLTQDDSHDTLLTSEAITTFGKLCTEYIFHGSWIEKRMAGKRTS